MAAPTPLPAAAPTGHGSSLASGVPVASGRNRQSLPASALVIASNPGRRDRRPYEVLRATGQPPRTGRQPRAEDERPVSAAPSPVPCACNCGGMALGRISKRTGEVVTFLPGPPAQERPVPRTAQDQEDAGVQGLPSASSTLSRQLRLATV